MERCKLIFERMKKNIPAIILCLIIVILLSLVSYDRLNLQPKNINIEFEGRKIETKDGVKNINGNMYISMEDIKIFFGSDVYFDKISRKLIFTTSQKLAKIKLIQENGSEVLLDKGKYYINLEKIANIYNKEMLNIDIKNKIILTSKVSEESYIKNNNVSLYYNQNKNDIYNINIYKNQNVVILEDENIMKSEWVQIKFKHNGRDLTGYVLRKYVQIDYSDVLKKLTKPEAKRLTNIVMIRPKSNDILLNKKVNMVAVDLFEVSGVKGSIRTNNQNKILDKIKNTNVMIYGIVSNAYDAANFDINLVSGLLSSDESRERLINNIMKSALQKNLDGVILDFQDMKLQDKDLYTQFVKETVARLKENNIKLGVMCPIQEYIDIAKISVVADLIVLKAYNLREVSSMVSGPTSPANWLEDNIKSLKQDRANISKIILEISTNSILWKEKNGLIVNAEEYTLDSVHEYILKNKLKTKTDNTAKQKYIEHINGSKTYKMWIEDDYSILQKVSIVNENKMLGISLYNSNELTNKIWEVLNVSN